jgi:acid stress-induced BolA-like protein IbaG/YrbA
MDKQSMDSFEIEALIQRGLPGCEVRVQSDDNTHFSALVISDTFDGKRAIARHQLVYKCLGTLMGGEIHALSIRAHTPDEWARLATDA